MLRALIAVAVYAAWNVALAASPLDEIKGIHLGDTESTSVALGLGCHDESSVLGDRSCNRSASDRDTLAGADSHMHVYLYGGKVHSVRISLKSRDFAGVLAALTEKYGTPSCRNEDIQLRAGGRADNQICIWKSSSGTLTATRLLSDNETSIVALESLAYDGFVVAKLAAMKKKSGDL